MASESIVHSAFDLMGYWLRARNNCSEGSEDIDRCFHEVKTYQSALPSLFWQQLPNDNKKQSKNKKKHDTSIFLHSFNVENEWNMHEKVGIIVQVSAELLMTVTGVWQYGSQ